MTALDRIQDVADMMAEWPSQYGWVNDINRALADLRPLLAAARAIAQDGPGHWQPANIAALIAAYESATASTPVDAPCSHEWAEYLTLDESGLRLEGPLHCALCGVVSHVNENRHPAPTAGMSTETDGALHARQVDVSVSPESTDSQDSRKLTPVSTTCVPTPAENGGTDGTR